MLQNLLVKVLEWWIADGVNFLEGIPGEAFDPAVDPPIIDECTGEILYVYHGANLSDHMIICLLKTVPEARASARRLLPTLDPDERARIQSFFDGPARELNQDPEEYKRTFMRRMNGMPQISNGPGPLAPDDPRRNG